jgi:hypothetical protein
LFDLVPSSSRTLSRLIIQRISQRDVRRQAVARSGIPLLDRFPFVLSRNHMSRLRATNTSRTLVVRLSIKLGVDLAQPRSLREVGLELLDARLDVLLGDVGAGLIEAGVELRTMNLFVLKSICE